MDPMGYNEPSAETRAYRLSFLVLFSLSSPLFPAVFGEVLAKCVCILWNQDHLHAQCITTLSAHPSLKIGCSTGLHTDVQLPEWLPTLKKTQPKHDNIPRRVAQEMQFLFAVCYGYIMLKLKTC